MVHVLRQLHKALKPDGKLLDVHPLPQHNRVEVARDDARIVLGHLDSSGDFAKIRAARRRLNAVERDGLFRREGRRFFDLHMHFDTIGTWMETREEHGWTSEIPREVLQGARGELSIPGSSLVVVERSRATAFSRGVV